VFCFSIAPNRGIEEFAPFDKTQEETTWVNKDGYDGQVFDIKE